jgi:hypothetical protein
MNQAAETAPKGHNESPPETHKLTKALQDAKPAFVQELARARYLWHAYPRLVMSETLPEWAAEYEPRHSNSPTSTETILISADILQPAKKIEFDQEADDHLGLIQILRREMPYESKNYDEWHQRWVDQLPEVLDHLDTEDAAYLVCAGALLQSNFGIDTPFENFVEKLLKWSMHHPMSFNEVHDHLYGVDGMLSDWKSLVRADRRIKADFPEGVEEAQEEK